MTRLIFRDRITGSNSSGKQSICRGEFAVIIDQIPPDPATDWTMGPKMKPGEFGAFIAHGFYPAGHGGYAFAVGVSPSAAFTEAVNHFAGKFCQWPRMTI